MGTSRRSSLSSSRAFDPRPPQTDADLDGSLYLAQVAIREILRRQELERSLSAQSRFVSMMAHDLRSPLTVIKSCAGLMKGAPAAARIIRMVDRSDAMIRDMLDFQSVRSGRVLRVKPRPMDLGAMVRSILSELAVVHGDRFELRISAGLRGSWDPDAVRRVVENLVSNALKYGAAGAPVSVRAERNGKWACVSVRNRGMPIPKDDLARIFKPFQRGHGVGKAEGWGLGLALVEAICRAHGGRITVRSSRAGGTVFTAYLKA